MTFETELRDRIDKVLNEEWNTREGGSVPHTDDIALRNGAV